MNTHITTDNIKQWLDLGTQQLDEHTLTQLKKARIHAINHHTTEHEPRFLSWASATALASLTLCAIIFTQQAGHYEPSQIGNIDIAILTDTLPLDVFIDKI